MKEMERAPEAAILNQAGCQKSQIVASLPAGSPLLPLPPGSDSRLAVYGTSCPRWRRSLDRSQDKAGLEIDQPPVYQGRPEMPRRWFEQPMSAKGQLKVLSEAFDFNWHQTVPTSGENVIASGQQKQGHVGMLVCFVSCFQLHFDTVVAFQTDCWDIMILL